MSTFSSTTGLPFRNAAKVNYPVELVARPRKDGFKAVFMDSMAIPDNFFKLFNNDDAYRRKISSFAKWRIDFCPENTTELTNVEVAMLSVVEKIVNRGRLTRLSKELEDKISTLLRKEAKNINSYSQAELEKIQRIAAPIVYAKYQDAIVPNEWHDGQNWAEAGGMTAEEYFYKKVFLQVVGIEYARDIIPQVSFRSLALGCTDEAILSQRVDFLITHDAESMVVEIDDPTHLKNSAEDRQRDTLLADVGLKVFRITTEDLFNNGPSLENFKKKLKELYGDKSKNNKALYTQLTAIKMAHQFQLILVELLKYRKIEADAHYKIAFAQENVPSLNAETQRKILQLALEDLQELSLNVATIYQQDGPFFHQIEICGEEEAPDLIISINEKSDLDLNNLVLLQEINYPFALTQARFTKLTRPKVVADREAIKYLLNYIFRFNDFRPNQFDGIKLALERQDAIVLLPTGSGKSIIYQLISFILPGTVLVIDPIVALIDDQIDNLLRRGVDRTVGVSGSTKDRSRLQKALAEGQYILAFVAPERLQILEFRETLQALCAWNVIPVCAIDEAHCVSEWGHEFRTSYLNLARTCRRILKTTDGAPTILALTGTASNAVLRDMEHDLEIPDENVVRPRSFDRKEIEYIVFNTESKNKFQVLNKILNQDLPQKFNMTVDDFYEPNSEKTMAGIIFCLHSSKTYGVGGLTENINRWPQFQKRPVEMYASKTPKEFSRGSNWDEHKKRVAKRYKDNDFSLLVATKAFGMGVDKPNIRYTIHYGLPHSVESYYQEAGRAGRDHQQAYSYIIASNDYPDENRKLLSSGMPLSEASRYKRTQKDNQDDVDRVFYFHNLTFDGIEKELKFTRQVLNEIGDLDKAHEVEIKHGENKNQVEKVIYRLIILGVIDDYTADFKNGLFSVKVNAFDREQIIKSYSNYIRDRQDNDDYVAHAESMVRSIKTEEPKEFVTATIRILLEEYIYKTIERSRRIAFSNLLEITTRAAEIKDEKECGRYMRKKILEFLGNTEEELVQEVTGSAKDFIRVVEIIHKCPKNRREKLYAQANRALESAPDNPSLQLARLHGKMATSERNIPELLNIIAEIFRDSEKYGISFEDASYVIVQAINDFEADEKFYMTMLNSIFNSQIFKEPDKRIFAAQIPDAYRSIYLMYRLRQVARKLNNLGKGNPWKKIK